MSIPSGFKLQGAVTREFGKGWKKPVNKFGQDRNWAAAEYFGDLEIPESWGSVEDFANWYMSNRMPWMVPWDAEVIVSDDATAITVFRKGRFQVELYLVHPNMAIPTHSHPGMESVIIRLGAGNLGRRLPLGVSEIWGAMAPVLHAGEVHGGRPLGFSPKGYAMLTFQQWDEGLELSSAAVQWRGDTAGPKQDALIKAHLPAAFVEPGFADVTQGPDGHRATASAARALGEQGTDFLPSTDLGA